MPPLATSDYTKVGDLQDARNIAGDPEFERRQAELIQGTQDSGPWPIKGDPFLVPPDSELGRAYSKAAEAYVKATGRAVADPSAPPELPASEDEPL